ncbi:protein lines [Cloeon dipterum]
MTEPVKKRARVHPGVDVVNQPQEDRELVALQELLLSQCLCSLPEVLDEVGWLERRILPQGACTAWTRDQALLFVSTLQLLCETSYKQLSSQGIQCRRLARMCDAVVTCNYRLIELLISDELCGGCDPYVRFASGRALPALLVASRQRIDPMWLETLADAALVPSPLTATFALDVFRRVLEWRDVDCHPTEDASGASTSSSVNSYASPVGSCNQVPDPEGADSQAAKCACIHALESRWTLLVNHYDSLMASYASANEAAITTFVALWEAIISVKANLSVVDTKPFYSHLDGFVVLLGPNLPPLLWKRLLGLFNEVMCYGSTLALQDTIAEEPCALAHLVVRSVKDWHLLDALPFRSGNGGFGGRHGGSSEEGDRPLLQKMCLLVLKSVAVTVKETRSDSSSSDASSSSGGGGNGGSSEEEAAAAADDMAVIARSIAEVLRRLDACVKSLMPFHPETPLAQWVVQLFSDQDDALVEGMVCCLDVEVGLSVALTSSLVSNTLRTALSPTQTFAQFLRTVSHDHEVLLDLLVSNETCFLLYLLRFLKYARRQWSDFVAACDRELENIMTVLIRLRISINRLVSKALFPYNIKPVLRLLEKCERMYEDGDFH